MQATLPDALPGTAESIEPAGLLLEHEQAELDGWAARWSGGDDELAAVLVACVRRFLRRHGAGVVVDPAPGWRCLVRVHRAAAALRQGGGVASVEMLAITDIAAFESSRAERAYVLDSTNWDNNAALFSPLAPPRRTTGEPPRLDWDGAECRRRLDDQVWQFELLLNADLYRRHPGDGLLEPVHAVQRGVGLRSPPPGHRHLMTMPLEGIRAILGAVQARCAAHALAEFRTHLEPGALQGLEAACVNSVRGYNWLCGFERGGCDPGRARLRIQACQAYPLAWPLISAPSGPVRDAVESMQPLLPVLAGVLEVDEACMRRLGGVSPAWVGMAQPDIERVRVLAQDVSCMPPGGGPRTAGGWGAYLGSLELCRSMARLIGSHAAGEALLASGAGRWDSLDVEVMRPAAAGIADMVGDIHANALAPAARLVGLAGWDIEHSAGVISRGRSLAQLGQASAWWHGTQVELHRELAGQYPPSGPDGAMVGMRNWPPLHRGPPWTAPNGLEVHVLCNEAALVCEHEHMGHCVNTYAGRCLTSGAHVLSIRRPGTQVPIGTFEVEQAALLELVAKASPMPDALLTDLPPSVVQFKAQRNAVPAMEGWSALWAYMAALMEGELKVDSEGLKSGLDRRKLVASNYPDGAGMACYDEQAEGAVVAAWRLYAPGLPRALARRGPRGLLAPGPGALQG